MAFMRCFTLYLILQVVSCSTWVFRAVQVF